MDATQKQNFNAPEVKLHFLDYWRIIRIRKTVILAVFLLVAITTTLVTFILPESYASTVRMKVEKDAPDVSLSGERPYMGFDPYWVQDQFETIQSKSILYPVISNLHLNTLWAQKLKEEGDLRTEVTYALLKNKIDVRQARNTSLIEVKVFSDDKNEAAVIANEIADVYRLQRRDQRQEIAKGGIKVLEQELEKQTTEVTNLQAYVDKLKTDLNISDLEANSTTFGMAPTLEPEMLRKLAGMRIEAQSDFTHWDTTYSYLTNLTRKELRKAVLTVVPDPVLVELLNRHSTAEQELSRKLETFGPENPEVKTIRAVWETTSREIDERLEGILTGLRAKRESEKARLNQLELDLSANQTNDINKAKERRPYFQAKRDLESKQYIREKLIMKVLQEQVDAATPRSLTVRIIDPAEPGLRPVKPNKFLNIALGVIVGLGIGIGLAFFIEYLDTSVKTIDDVERALQAPVLGVIPQNVGSLVDEGPDSSHAEAYRVLRTNIM